MDSQHDDKYEALARIIKQLLGLITGLVLLVILLFGYIIYLQPKNVVIPESVQAPVTTTTATPPSDNTVYWKSPDISTLDTSAEKEKILYGKALIASTAIYFGPQGKVKMNATNGMNCQNCHLDAGTKIFGNNYGSVFSTYPRYRARSGTIENIYKRVNDCFERSLNGEALDTSSKEMEAIVAYIQWLGKDVPKEEKAEGSGLKEIEFLDRAADPAKGKVAYAAKCQSCHMENGGGQINPEKTAYTFPPLWGPNSYNTGAGLYRISSFAKYVKYNMPLGVTHTSTILSDEEAWDIAAYVNSQPRPTKNIKYDWPKIEEKPFDHPFGPFADGFDENQHKFGPFKPIKDKQEAMKKNKKS